MTGPGEALEDGYDADGFARGGGAVTSPADLFSEQNVRRLLGGERRLV